MPNRAAGPRMHPGPSLPASRQGQEARSAASPPLLAPKCPRPSYGSVVALKFVAFERDKKVGQIAFCDWDRSATHRLTTNWQLHWTPPPRTGFGLPRCNGWPQLDRVFDTEPDLVERSGRLATSSGLIGGRFPYNARCRDSLEARLDQHQRNATLSRERRTGLRKQQGPDSKRIRP